MDGSTPRLPKWGSVAECDGPTPWLVVDEAGEVVEPIRRYLVEFAARGNRPSSVRSYAYDLLRWWRWLRLLDVPWERATSAAVRDYSLWLAAATKPGAVARTTSAATAGTVNPITRKAYLNDRYQPRTVRHALAVLREFYEYWAELGEGPVVNPVQRVMRARPNAHHNPMDPFLREGRMRYNPPIPKRRPRTLSDEQWRDVFAALRSHRDRALLALTLSNGARASELLGLRGIDIDWGDQLIRVIRKGRRAEQWLPASAEAFVWLRLYLAQADPVGPNEPIWRTIRRRDRGAGLAEQSLTYDALRAVFRRVNSTLGTNWSMHDLRHTAALRMSRDPNLTLRDVQVILGVRGHGKVSTGGRFVVPNGGQVRSPLVAV
ncbi:site-specific integrase [Skermania sp. ID1734]|uniref:tyrosine-type recombinase/integrase n=1 Tax=Skermania sp. ID1734 TaxID=2597516 RepID=UPI0011810303|nr:site-specific integrase [Skermania sp. ID1734]TSD99818.1 site-specific integrase [Skermania sp. ID1734]